MSAKPTPAQARAIVAALSPIGIIRSLPLPGNNSAYDLDAAELVMWLDLGVEMMAYQHVRFGRGVGWDPRNHSGAEDGAYAAQHWLDCGGATGVHLWIDWEDIIPSLPPAAGKVYLEAWAERVRIAGMLAGEYCGFDDPMSAVDRYNLHGITSYWSDAGRREVATRGCAIVQGREVTVAGLRIDLDQLAPDLLGEVPMAAAA